jgi:hypothetical protein
MGIPLSHDGASLACNLALPSARKTHLGETLDDAAVMLGDFRIEKPAAQCLEAFERAFLVRLRAGRECPANIGGKDRGALRLAGYRKDDRDPPFFFSASIFFGST